MEPPPDQERCPVCGQGVFTDVIYEEPELGGPEPRLAADGYEVLLYSCGHRVKGTRLDLADPEEMTVERRESDETVEPVTREDVEPTGEGSSDASGDP